MCIASYALIILGTLLMVGGFTQMPYGVPPSPLALTLVGTGALVFVGGCTLYWWLYERRPMVPVWEGPPRTIIPPARRRRSTF